MNEHLWVAPVVLVTVAVGFAIYSTLTRGLKGAMFGHKIAVSDDVVIEYRHQAAKHTIRLHKLGSDGLYGLEIGRWATIFGETSPIVIPRQNLLQLRDQITQFVEGPGK